MLVIMKFGLSTKWKKNDIIEIFMVLVIRKHMPDKK